MSSDDPVVERVRAARKRINEQCDQDKHRLFEWAKEIESQHRDRVVTYERARRRKQ